MRKVSGYTKEHAEAGLDFDFPAIETWPNQFPGYEIVVDDPEFTSVCPKTGLPDFGLIVIRYMPDKHCLELKSLKEYLQSYRNLGIFQENIVNQVLEDVVRHARPVWAEVFVPAAAFPQWSWLDGRGPKQRNPDEAFAARSPRSASPPEGPSELFIFV